MSHTSPATYLVWAVFSTLLGAFLFFHLWSFDRFKCLKWNSGPTSGAFKRVMTYSYLTSVPLIMAYAIGYSYIKYHEGYMVIPGHGIIPKPSSLWRKSYQDAIFPLNLMFSIAWSLEMVTHLEELCFWLFLVNAGQSQQDWFRSPYFKVWVAGSICAVASMPAVTAATRSDPHRSEAATFLAGSLGSLSLTLWFMPVLWTFPTFLRNLRNEGVDMQTVVRLTKFHELNTVRVVFRFLFTVPFVILGADGVRKHSPINESLVWTDCLAMIAAVGCCISSGITLVIFFPRSIESEIAARDASRAGKRSRSRSEFRVGTPSTYPSRANTPSIPTYPMTTTANVGPTSYGPPMSPASVTTAGGGGAALDRNYSARTGTYLLTASPVAKATSLSDDDMAKEPFALSGFGLNTLSSNGGMPEGSPPGYVSTYPMSTTTKGSTLDPERDAPRTLVVPSLPGVQPNRGRQLSLNTAPPEEGAAPTPLFYTPNRRRNEHEGGGVELGAVNRLTQRNLTRLDDARNSGLGRLLQNYSSPLDVAYASGQPRSQNRSNHGHQV